MALRDTSCPRAVANPGKGGRHKLPPKHGPEDRPCEQHAESCNNEHNGDLRWDPEPTLFCGSGFSLCGRTMAELPKELAIPTKRVLTDGHSPFCAHLLGEASITMPREGSGGLPKACSG